MIIGKYVLSDLEADKIQIPTQTTWGAEVFQTVLTTDPTTIIDEIKERQLPLLAFRHPDMTTTVAELKGIVGEVGALNITGLSTSTSTSTSDNNHNASIEQIYWSPKSFAAFLNLKAYVISALVVWKTLVLPGISVVVPILSIILPFLILKFIRGIPLEVGDYLSHMRQTLLRQINVPAILKAKHAGDHLGHMFETAFLAITVATFASSIWNQIQTARHQRDIAHGCLKHGETLTAVVGAVERALAVLEGTEDRFRAALHRLITSGRVLLDTTFASMSRTEPYAAFGWLWNTPAALVGLKDWVGRLDVALTIAGMPNICLPRVLDASDEANGLVIRGVCHPGLSESVSNDADFGGAAKHVLLTGPNRGGKSTFCRAVGLAILCAQTWGFAWATDMSYTPFRALQTALSPADVLGRLSLFESEIEFAKEVLAIGGEGPVFVMMDEIFHSTNAHDGVEASRIFLEKLYKLPAVTSLISTHYRELVDLVGATGWYMECRLDDKDNTTKKLTYTYKVKTGGVSEHSSVFEILEERGLI